MNRRSELNVPAIVVGVAVVSAPASADTVIFDNGPIVSHPGAGFGGADVSVGWSGGLGLGADAAAFALADDFVLSAAAMLTRIRLFTYEVNSSGSTVSTITGASVRVWDASPAGGGANLLGTYSTMLSNTWSGVYRTQTTQLTSRTRAIMGVDVDLTGLNLAAGTYWVEYAFNGSPTLSGPFGIFMSSPTGDVAGNAIHKVSGTWRAAINNTPMQVGLPMQVFGGDGPTIPLPTPAGLGIVGLGVLAGPRRRAVVG